MKIPKKLPGNIKLTLNTNPEKVIAAVSLSTALAILTSGSRKGRGGRKSRPGFIQRTVRNYKLIDKLLMLTLAKGVKENEKRILTEKEFKTKLRDLTIEDAIPFAPTEETSAND